MTAQEILHVLAEKSHQIEEHEAAVFLLRQEHLALQTELLRSGWKPPPIPQEGDK